MAHIREGLEFQSIASRVEEEHRRLLPRLPSKASVGFDDELYAGVLDTGGKRLPLGRRQYHSEMGHGDLVAVHRIVAAAPTCARLYLMRDDLMAEQIEVDPFIAASPFRAA